MGEKLIPDLLGNGPLPQPKKTEKQALAEVEHGVFDSITALTAAVEKEILVGVLIGQRTVELIFPQRPGAHEDDNNPSRLVDGTSTIAALAMAGELVHQMIVIENQNHANHTDYIAARDRNRKTRAGTILLPKAN